MFYLITEEIIFQKCHLWRYFSNFNFGVTLDYNEWLTFIITPKNECNGLFFSTDASRHKRDFVKSVSMYFELKFH